MFRSAAALVAAVTVVGLAAVARDTEATDWPFPHINVTFTNDTGEVADGISVYVYPATNFDPITANPPGCGWPSYEYINWPYDPSS
jgi:hypothetical protein